MGDTGIDLIAFDADDTLWQSETLYWQAQQKFQELLATYHGDDGVLDELYDTEMTNLPYYGYGIKSFALSMIETALRVTRGQIDGRDVQEIIDWAKEMLQAPVQLLDHVADVIPALSRSYPLMVITKGDLFDQEAKVERSGLAAHFDRVEVVADKTPDVYRRLLARSGIAPQRFLMVGNSLRSDVLPVVSLGAHAVHIPHPVTWAHELVPVQPVEAHRYVELEHIGLLPDYVEQIGRTESGG
jgi:putative hydrolase of the HAD superfamily